MLMRIFLYVIDRLDDNNHVFILILKSTLTFLE